MGMATMVAVHFLAAVPYALRYSLLLGFSLGRTSASGARGGGGVGA